MLIPQRILSSKTTVIVMMIKDRPRHLIKTADVEIIEEAVAGEVRTAEAAVATKEAVVVAAEEVEGAIRTTTTVRGTLIINGAKLRRSRAYDMI